MIKEGKSFAVNFSLGDRPSLIYQYSSALSLSLKWSAVSAGPLTVSLLPLIQTHSHPRCRCKAVCRQVWPLHLRRLCAQIEGCLLSHLPGRRGLRQPLRELPGQRFAPSVLRNERSFRTATTHRSCGRWPEPCGDRFFFESANPGCPGRRRCPR